MTSLLEKDTAVIIPARNEEDRIQACLNALGRQGSAGVTVILVVNNTTDRTCDMARAAAARHDLHLVVLEHEFPADQGVGTARKIGCDHALQTMPNLRYILTSDADCIVGRDWIARNCAHLETVDAVCGKVSLIMAEADILDGMDRHFATLEGTYRELVQNLYARHAPGCGDIADTHGEAAGASLGFTKSAYLAVGGFACVQSSEDRLIIRALRYGGRKVRHVHDVTVRASCRLNGRAAGGMSDALKARITGRDYVIDDCLPRADWLVEHADRNTLGPWPPQVPARYRLNVRDLPDHIRILQLYRNSRRKISVSMGQDGALRGAQFDVL